MTSPKLLWPIFFLLTVVTLVATGWVSMCVVRLEQDRIAEAKRAKVEENVSLALWRIDSFVTPLVAIENARPFQKYGLSFQNEYPQQREDPKLDNRYFTLEILSGRGGLASTVRAIDGDVPKPLREATVTSHLIATLPKPTIRLSDPPMMQFGSGQGQIKQSSPSFPNPKRSGGKGQSARSASEYNARQSTLNRAMQSYTTNPANANQSPQPVQQESSQMPGYGSQSFPSSQYRYSQPAVPQVPTTQTQPLNFPPPNASAPPQTSQPQTSQPQTSQPQAPTPPAPNEGTFYLPLPPSMLLPIVLGQVSYTPPPSAPVQQPQQAGPQGGMPIAAPSEPAVQSTQTLVPSLSPFSSNSSAAPTTSNDQVAPLTPPAPGWVPYGNSAPGPQYTTPQAAQSVPAVAEGVWAPMQPVCLGDQLLLLRRVRLGNRSLLQGCLFDWPHLARILEQEVTDLLPAAHLVLDEEKKFPGRMLASLPARIEPGPLPAADMAPFIATLTPVLTSVAIAFGCVLLSIGAFAVLLLGLIRLGRRRSEFVTAVTHELRTPLTTFRMYSEMLAEGMVEPASQKSYLQTLESEADRLTHLVENVLSSARLERGRHAGRLETIPIGELITSIASRLAKRCEQAEMRLEVEMTEQVNGTKVQTNPSAVEQILWNLVDNACKYAVSADDRTIRLTCEVRENQTVAITVSDHGPGIPRDVRRRLFCGFSKTASEAACSAPGVGLGLALSRRLARDLGGNLELVTTEQGASFMLSLE